MHFQTDDIDEYQSDFKIRDQHIGILANIYANAAVRKDYDLETAINYLDIKVGSYAYVHSRDNRQLFRWYQIMRRALQRVYPDDFEQDNDI